jgi:hypothetical protein
MNTFKPEKEPRNFVVVDGAITHFTRTEKGNGYAIMLASNPISNAAEVGMMSVRRSFELQLMLSDDQALEFDTHYKEFAIIRASGVMVGVDVGIGDIITLLPEDIQWGGYLDMDAYEKANPKNEDFDLNDYLIPMEAR